MAVKWLIENNTQPVPVAFSALTLLVGCQEEHLAVKIK